MRLPVFQVGRTAEDDPDASSSKADVELAAVPRPMLFKPLRKPWVIPIDAFQLEGASHVLFLDAPDHRLTFVLRAGM